MASKTSNTSCPAEKYKDIKCPQTKKGQKKILLKIHPDRNRGCTELARKLSQKILNCPYEANGNLDNVELITRAMEQKVAAGAAAHAASTATKSTVSGINTTTQFVKYLDSYSMWVEEKNLKETMLAFKELVEEPVNIHYPYPNLPKYLETVFPGEADPQEFMDKEKIKANINAEKAANSAKNSHLKMLSDEVRKAHDLLKAAQPKLAGRTTTMSGRRRWVRKTPNSKKMYFAKEWAKGVLRREGHATHTDRGSGPWYSGGKSKTKKKRKKKTQKRKNRKKAYGKKNIWLKFGKDMECNHKLRRCRKIKFSPIIKSLTKKSKTKKSKTKKSKTKKSKERKTYTTVFSKKSKTTRKKIFANK